VEAIGRPSNMRMSVLLAAEKKLAACDPTHGCTISAIHLSVSSLRRSLRPCDPTVGSAQPFLEGTNFSCEVG
jgi:hypothetical protein